MKKQNQDIPDWLQPKNYVHLTPPVNIQRNPHELVKKLKDEKYISRHAFYPLMYYELKNRRYKFDPSSGKKKHAELKKGEWKPTVKMRPIHFATHLDALVFGCYAAKVLDKYEAILKDRPLVNDAVLAYRKIPVPGSEKNKGTIHFAKEIFDLIKEKAVAWGEVGVLAFDIKSFFPSLNHKRLHDTWKKVLNVDYLPDDHQNVYKAATRFSYIMRDELRVSEKGRGRRAPFDEKELARIRNEKGISAFFESPKAFRDAIKEGRLKFYREPFGKGKGIPQGLPISSVLANMYMLDFDTNVCTKLTEAHGIIYRRYSDDMLVICRVQDMDWVNEFMKNEIQQSQLTISDEKTERFIFKEIHICRNGPRLQSHKMKNGEFKPGPPLTYLGFEFDGSRPLIKSANLSKFYRRLIYAVKNKAKRAEKASANNPDNPKAIFVRQLYRLYQDRDLSKYEIRKRWKKIIGPNEYGKFSLKTGEKEKPFRSNYLSYLKRASEIMNEPAIFNQIRKHKLIFQQAMLKHWIKKKRK